MKQMTIFDYLDVKEEEPEFSEETKMILEIFRQRKGKDKYIDRAALRELVQSF